MWSLSSSWQTPPQIFLTEVTIYMESLWYVPNAQYHLLLKFRFDVGQLRLLVLSPGEQYRG